MNTTVFIIDSDLGFAFWLGRALDSSGSQAFPSRSVSDARALLADSGVVPALVILGGVPAGAEAFISRLRQRYRDVRIMWLSEDGDSLDQSIRTDCEFRKPVHRDEADRVELIDAVNRVLTHEPVSLQV